MIELAEKVGKYVDTEEFLKIKNFDQVDEGSCKSKQKQDVPKKDIGKRPRKGQQKRIRDPLLTTFTPLSRPI